MKRTPLITSIIVGILMAGAQSVIAELDGPPSSLDLSPRSSDEYTLTIAALRPPKRSRPVIAVLGDNQGTETTDFLVPYGVLAESGLADVFAVAPSAKPIQLMPALRISPQLTTTAFDQRYPLGADYVVVPAMHRIDSPRVIEWIRSQFASGATLVGICSGAMVLAETGLLGDRKVTTHWFDRDSLERENPDTIRVDDRRYVVDRRIVTTTGVTASVPVSLAIVEAIGGRREAAALAARLGVSDWGQDHDSSHFRLDWRIVTLAARNRLAFWSHERIGVDVRPGVDELALALTADAYSHTFKTSAFAVSPDATPIRTKRGLELLPDGNPLALGIDYFVPSLDSAFPIRSLDRALASIECRYGARVASFVALQLEYPTVDAPLGSGEVQPDSRGSRCGRQAQEASPSPGGRRGHALE